MTQPSKSIFSYFTRNQKIALVAVAVLATAVVGYLRQLEIGKTKRGVGEVRTVQRSKDLLPKQSAIKGGAAQILAKGAAAKFLLGEAGARSAVGQALQRFIATRVSNKYLVKLTSSLIVQGGNAGIKMIKKWQGPASGKNIFQQVLRKKSY